MNWFYVQDDGASKAEVGEAQFCLRVAQGLIKRETLVWREGQADWLPCAQVRPELFAALPAAAPAPASPPPGYAPPAPASPPPGYAPPMPGMPPVMMVMTPPTDQMAVISMVSGIISVVSLLACPGPGLFIGLPAVICGHMAHKKIAHSQGQLSGAGLALTGIITGYLGILINLVIILFVGIIFSSIMSGFPSSSFPSGLPGSPGTTPP